ncbi:TIGR04104 family putative zinc finger protein [Neobacillus sp. OS1-33]|uniref:TIGR04104 family putative zinc finger protein n=1 Tax=Neobacillus sp. OS1-33 TaxID=3070683 RepID=UPI0035A7132B
MQKCVTCGHQFTWKEIQRSIRWTYKPLVCKECGTKHNPTMKTKVTISFIVGIILFPLLLLNLPFYLELVLIITFFLIVIAFFPYFAKYSANRNE